ncbi:FecR family protein [Psychroserpens sp. XS_ASV72]|uniref:FecR family protein n=1 Tax=Psychroserpens sp. XS_ASV72 TaxID=3241293 RepID=UPI003516F8ED
MKKQDLQHINDTYLAKWLSGELTDEQLKDLVSEADYNAFLKLRKGVDAYVDLNTETDTSFEVIQKRIANTKATKVRTLGANRWWIGIAASIVVLFGLFYILNNDVTQIETQFGEQKTLVLLDGSEVILNSKSTIRYNEADWKENRALELDGEAYFKVTKGSKFTVKTNYGTVEVLGTQFNVKTNLDLFEVACYEGKVRVESNNESVILLPTNNVRRINGYDLEQWNAVETDPSWLDGESTFKSVPLKYVISALESQYNVTFDTTQIDTNIIYTGGFPNDSLNIALQTVFKTLDITYNEKEKGVIYLNVK